MEYTSNNFKPNHKRITLSNIDYDYLIDSLERYRETLASHFEIDMLIKSLEKYNRIRNYVMNETLNPKPITPQMIEELVKIARRIRKGEKKEKQLCNQNIK